MDRLTQLLSDLVAIDSVNPDLVPGGAGEGAVARFIAGWLADAGLEVHLDEVRPGRPNVIALARGSGAGRTLLLNGHTDTVGVAGMAAPHRPVVSAGRLAGRGAYDMKGGLAAAMLAAASARGAGLRGDLILTAVMDEEHAGLGTLDAAARYRADAALIAEPTELELVCAHKGFAWLEVETIGAAAHGSILGAPDAIAQMGRVLVGVEAINRRLLARPAHPLLQSGSLHAGLIRGGQEPSSYPASCLLTLERRTLPGETPAQAAAEIAALLDQIRQADPGFRAELRPGLSRAPMEADAEGPLPSLLRAEAAAVLGAPVPLVGVHYWTDAATLAEAGVPAVLFGPRGAGAHAVDEWVDLESVRQCAEIYRRVIAGFCA